MNILKRQMEEQKENVQWIFALFGALIGILLGLFINTMAEETTKEVDCDEPKEHTESILSE